MQFPKPVIVTEVRIIPLGAKVQADFPGGVRLGATNPSQFNIEFFVNDLSKPGASTFESLGGFEYSQNGRIHLECEATEDVRKIPTDGLVLRGWYTTITLAVYGCVTKNIAETIPPTPVSGAQSSVNPVMQIHPETEHQQQQAITPIQNTEWQQQEMPSMMQIDNYIDGQASTDVYSTPGYNESYESQAYTNNYYDPNVPKDPRTFQHDENEDWQNTRDKTTTNVTPLSEQHEIEISRTHRRSTSSDGNCDRKQSAGYSRSPSRDRDYKKLDYRSRSPSTEYRSNYSHKRDHRSRDSSYDNDRSYNRCRDTSYDRDEVKAKRPRTPPMERPRTPEELDIKLSPVDSLQSEDEKLPEYDSKYNLSKGKNHPIETIDKNLYNELDDKKIERIKVISPRSMNNTPGTPLESPADEGLSVDEEQFEPILSDEDIADENDSQFADDYDYMEYLNNDDIVKLFDPFNMELIKYKKEADNEVSENLLTLCHILKENMNICSVESFKLLTTDLKEAWIEVLEQLPSLLNTISSKEILSIDKDILDLLICWLDISLQFDLALSNQQPGFKIRHIKCGIRVCESFCMHHDVFKTVLSRKHNVIKSLLDLYFKDYMSLSIKLMIIKALDMLLSNAKTVEYFLENEDLQIVDESKNILTGNGYKILLSMLQKNPLSRIKFAIKSLLRKLHIFEVLKKLKRTVLLWCKGIDFNTKHEEILESEIELVAQCLNDIKDVYVKNLSLAQPRRFLPVNSQFDTSYEAYDRTALFDFFGAHKTLECISLIFNHPAAANISILISPIIELLTVICKNYDGLVFLSENLAIVNVLVRSLLQTHCEEELVDVRSQNLGLEISYKLQTLYHMEYLSDIYKQNNEFVDQLHYLFCLCLNSTGRVHVSDVLAMSNHIKVLLSIFMTEKPESKYRDETGIKLKSTALGYAVDLIDIVVKNVSDVSYLKKYGKKILELTRQHEYYETSVASKLQEILVYVSPIDRGNIFNCDDISGLCEFLKKCVDTATAFPGDLITCVRVLKFLAISEKDGFQSKPDHIELKYKHVTLQLYSGDGVSSLVQILEKICSHFAQPGLHTSNLVSNQGLLAAQIIYPSCQLLRKMLSYVIACRDNMFKDLTAISTLLKVYNLMYNYPMNCPAWSMSRKILEEVVNTLLAYTQPISLEMNDTESLQKSLWSLLIGEILKFTMDGPSCFIPGLMVLSEMLPLPLPLMTKQYINDDEINTILTYRKLWSAHLHCQQTALMEMIQTLCQSSFQPLNYILRKVCLQIADLAPNMAVLVSKALIDLLLEESITIPLNQNASRLLYFFACLLSHGSIKISVVSSITSSFVTFLCTVLRTANDSATHLQGQDYVLNIIQSIFDTEIKLVSFDGDLDQFLANVIPSKDIFIALITGVLENVIQVNSLSCLPAVIRILSLIAEHNYGFYYMKQFLLKKPLVVLTIFQRILDLFKTNSDCLTLLSALLEFLQYISVSEEIDSILPRRTSILSHQDLITAVAWEDNKEHPIQLLDKLLHESLQEGNEEIYSRVKENLKKFLSILEKSSENSDNNAELLIEPSLPEPLNLITQFNKRIVHVGEVNEDKLTSSYWFNMSNCDEEQEMDQVRYNFRLPLVILSCLFVSMLEIWRQLCCKSKSKLIHCNQIHLVDQSVCLL